MGRPTMTVAEMGPSPTFQSHRTFPRVMWSDTPVRGQEQVQGGQDKLERSLSMRIWPRIAKVLLFLRLSLQPGCTPQLYPLAGFCMADGTRPKLGAI